MTMKSFITVAALLATAVVGLSGRAEAQAWSEANTPGYFGGYGHFGGYYDTFGTYGGHSTYNGYVRTESRQHFGTVTLLSVPLSRRTHAKVRHVSSSCDDARRTARKSGHPMRKSRQAECRRVV